MTWFIVQSLIILVLAFALGIVVGWLIWARRRPAAAGASTELATAKKDLAAAKKDKAAAEKELAAAKEQLAATKATKGQLAAAKEQLAVTEEKLAAAEKDLAACTCSTGAVPVAFAAVKVDDDADQDVEETVTTDEALGEVDADLDGPDKDNDVAALAVAVGALNATGEPDDIERIEGIGPKIGKALRTAGLDTYVAIADASQDTLREAIEAGGVTFAPSIESWSSQARLLADGDEAGFQDLTDRLVAGRIKD